MNFTMKTISIGGRLIDEITEDGVRWYPLSSFFRRILGKNIRTRYYRDTEYVKYMKVFKIKQFNAPSECKTWCINEEGIKLILQHVWTNRGRSATREMVRQKLLDDARIYFGVHTSETPIYTKVKPRLDEYDIWSVYCIECDELITPYVTWKRCSECGFYYPNNRRFYNITLTGNTSEKCLQCSGDDFVCANHIAQYIYENGGLDLLYALYKQDYDSVIDNLYLFLSQGGSTPYGVKNS